MRIVELCKQKLRIHQSFSIRLLETVVLMLFIVLLAPALFYGVDSHPLVVVEPKSPIANPKAPEFLSVFDTDFDEVNIFSEGHANLDDAQGKPGIDDDGHLKAWSLRLASFPDESNADKLQTKLRSKGYASYINKVVNGSHRKKTFIVYIGPDVRVDELRNIKILLKKEMGLSGVIVRFDS